ncbi:MAG: hypothetical protein LC721_02750, partial [Actinobacteria bacterium]|nr:hypothetical protein [Actinomycetota bacterium]
PTPQLRTHRLTHHNGCLPTRLGQQRTASAPNCAEPDQSSAQQAPRRAHHDPRKVISNALSAAFQRLDQEASLPVSFRPSARAR